MENKTYKKSTHDKCLGCRGIKYFICNKCGNDGANYSNGVNICKDCCSKDNLCRICGEVLDANNEQIKVFLGGTCNHSNWRDELISKLNKKVVDYFNPVVDNWTPECMDEELRQRELCDYCLYVITPRMIGVYSIAEVVDDSNKRPRKTLFCYLNEDSSFIQDLTSVKVKNLKFTDGQIRSLNQVSNLIKNNGGKIFDNLDSVAEYLNAIGEVKRVFGRYNSEVVESIINFADSSIEKQLNRGK